MKIFKCCAGAIKLHLIMISLIGVFFAIYHTSAHAFYLELKGCTSMGCPMSVKWDLSGAGAVVNKGENTIGIWAKGAGHNGIYAFFNPAGDLPYAKPVSGTVSTSQLTWRNGITGSVEGVQRGGTWLGADIQICLVTLKTDGSLNVLSEPTFTTYCSDTIGPTPTPKCTASVAPNALSWSLGTSMAGTEKTATIAVECDQDTTTVLAVNGVTDPNGSVDIAPGVSAKWALASDVGNGTTERHVDIVVTPVTNDAAVGVHQGNIVITAQYP